MKDSELLVDLLFQEAIKLKSLHREGLMEDIWKIYSFVTCRDC